MSKSQSTPDSSVSGEVGTIQMLPNGKAKKPAIMRACVCFGACRRQTSDHSHSMVAGGLPLTS